MSEYWRPLAQVYDPVMIGSIDGTDSTPHDHGISRALKAKYKPNAHVIGDPYHTIFVGRLSLKTTEDTLQKEFSMYGRIKRLRLVRDIVTGLSRKYAFIEYRRSFEAKRAYTEGHNRIIDDVTILVDSECERTLKGWVPRRLGGGFGGKKESGQLRFGCRDRPFKRPFDQNAKDKIENLQKTRHSSHSRRFSKEYPKK